MLFEEIKHKLSNADLRNYSCTEFGSGELFADIYGDDVKYKTSENTYCIWDQEKGVWEDDCTEKINEITKVFLSEHLPKLIENLENDEARQEYTAFILRQQNVASVSAILRCARSRPNMGASGIDFDKESKFLNVKNGVVNLETGEFLKHNKEFMLTKIANVIYDPNIQDKAWRKFFNRISDEDREWCRYFIRVIAYILRGKPVEHCMFMLYGPTTRNGKSTLVNALLNFCSGYGTTIPPESLSKYRNRFGGAPSPDIARLVGKRFINVAESSKNLPLDVAFVKALTGGDTIAIRKLYSDYEDFINNGVFMMHTNYLPKVDDNTIFTSKRIIVIPFDKHLEPNNIDTNMLEKLTNESAKSELLNMVVRAIKNNKGRSIKDNQPKRVKATTQHYMTKGDVFGLFAKTYIIKEQSEWLRTERIVRRYNKWAETKGFESLSSKAITSELKNRGFVPSRRNEGVGFKDIILKKVNSH